MATNFKSQLVTRATSKRRKKATKNANIAEVREQVEQRDGEQCRIVRLLKRFDFSRTPTRLELAHVDARGLGGNPRSVPRHGGEHALSLMGFTQQGAAIPYTEGW